MPSGQFTRKYHVNHDFFRTIDTADKAYLLGFIATDGCINKNTLAIVLKATDRPFLERITSVLDCNVPVREYECRPSLPGDKSRTKTYRSATLFITSQQIVRDLLAHGIGPRKTHTVEFWSGPDNLMPHYARGCLDGDGCIHFSKRDKQWIITFVGNPMMADGFAAFLKKRIGVSLRNRQDKGKYVVFYCCRVADTHAIAQFLYAGATLFLPRKKKLADAILATVPRLAAGYKDWSHLTKEDLEILYRECGNWSLVADRLGMARGSITLVKRQLGFPAKQYRNR